MYTKNSNSKQLKNWLKFILKPYETKLKNVEKSGTWQFGCVVDAASRGLN